MQDPYNDHFLRKILFCLLALNSLSSLLAAPADRPVLCGLKHCSSLYQVAYWRTQISAVKWHISLLAVGVFEEKEDGGSLYRANASLVCVSFICWSRAVLPAALFLFPLLFTHSFSFKAHRLFQPTFPSLTGLLVMCLRQVGADRPAEGCAGVRVFVRLVLTLSAWAPI